MQHYIITRFNLRLWPHDKHGAPTQTEAWLAERFRLFETYCLPSVARQEAKDFVWLVLFDSETPATWTHRFKTYQSQCPQFTPIMVSPQYGNKYAKAIRQAVAQHVQKRGGLSEGERVVTTYFDNDDALHRNFTLRIQQLAQQAAHNTVVSFADGLQYYEQLNIAVSIRFPNNHFISLVETPGPAADLRTVYGYGSHFFITRHSSCRFEFIDGERLWLEVVHGNNVDNDVKMSNDTHLARELRNLADFGLERQLHPHPQLVYHTRFFCRRLREMLRHVKYRLFGHHWWGEP